jgi:Transposase zinc-binding domain
MSGAAPRKYQQRRPERTALYGIIQEHLESFLTHAHESSGKRLPKYVENEFRRYLECGIHAHGFARTVCETCGDELLLRFSCKRRAICVSCNTRRMSNTAAHLVDRVIAPDLTLRQWVLTVPFELRLLLAAKPDALSAIGRLFVQEIQR